MKNVAIVLLILGCGALAFIAHKSNNRLEESFVLLEANELEAYNLKNNSQGVKNSLLWGVMSEGDVIDDLVVSTQNGDEVSMKTLVGSSSKFVLRYSELHCSSCVEKQILLFNKVVDRIGEDNVLIISSYTNNRDLLLFKRMNQIKLPVYNIKDANLGISAEGADSPIFFVLSNNLRVSNVFLPLEYDPILTEEYHERIMKKYWDDEFSDQKR